MRQIEHIAILWGMLCLHCGRFSDELLCPICSGELDGQSYEKRFPTRCPICARPLQDRAYPCRFCLKGLQAYGSYTGIVSALLNQYKAGEEKVMAKVLAPLLVPMLAKIEKPLLIPVPASRKSLSERGFDQMVLICKLLKRREGYPFLRVFSQKGESQSKFLSLEERVHRHSLSLLPLDKKVAQYGKEGYTFVLLDDICTTGSTLATCSSLLSERYEISVCSLVIALV